MPLTVPGVVGVLAPSIIFTGPGVMKYSRGVAYGLTRWAGKIVVETKDVGTGAGGKGTPLPLLVPQPLLLINIMDGMRAMNLLGLMAFPFIVGVSTGLNAAFLQMLFNTKHPSVGSGGALASFKAPPATPFIVAGFAQEKMTGDGAVRKARALAQGLDRTFASLVIPLPIVGTPSPSPSAGVGSGRLV